MQWKALSEEEVKGLAFAARSTRDTPYAEIFAAVEEGAVRVEVPEGGSLQALKWRLGRAIRKAGAKVVMATLADKSGVVLTKEEEATKE